MATLTGKSPSSTCCPTGLRDHSLWRRTEPSGCLPGHTGPACRVVLSTGIGEHEVASKANAQAKALIFRASLKGRFLLCGMGGASNIGIINKSLKLEATLNSWQEWVESKPFTDTSVILTGST